MRWKDFGSANGRKSKLTRREIYKNVFIELDYLENAIRSADSSAFAQVRVMSWSRMVSHCPANSGASHRWAEGEVAWAQTQPRLSQIAATAPRNWSRATRCPPVTTRMRFATGTERSSARANAEAPKELSLSIKLL